MTSENNHLPKAPDSGAKRTVRVTDFHIDDIVRRFMEQHKPEVKRPGDLYSADSRNRASRYDPRKSAR